MLQHSVSFSLYFCICIPQHILKLRSFAFLVDETLSFKFTPVNLD
jgi:hypothetical protein